MFSKCFHFVILTVIFLLLQGAACFFVKHVQTGMCIYATSKIQVDAIWGKLFAVELSNNCLDPAAQFRFLDNSAMFNLERKSCFEGKSSVLYFLLAIDPAGNCRDRDHAIAQTSWGGLSVYEVDSGQTPCAVPTTNTYIGLTTCSDAEDKRFNFGSVTCRGNMTKNANCPKDQYMVVKTASYRGLSATKTCGLSDDYSCEVDVTCLVKKQCDGQHWCNITVNETLFSGDPCPGLTNYLYFEYQCNDTATPSKEICVDGVSLKYSTLPNEGFVQIVTKYSGNKTVCWQSLTNEAANIFCRQLGYTRMASNVSKVPPSNQDAIFSGSIECNGGKQNLSQCSFTISNESCSEISYIECFICDRPLFEDKQGILDSSFTASASSKGRSPSDARISSGSSWCAPAADGKHYLQVDLGRLYVIYYFVTFGDTTSTKWVTTYNLNYTVDLINWKSVRISGNKNAYNDAAIQDFPGGITTRALRFMPLTYVVQPCMRIEICGATLLPDKPTNLTVTNIKSRSAEISWLDSENTGDGDLTGFWIKMKKENSIILSITINKVNKYEIDNLTPNTTYEISLAAGNQNGFGEVIITSFLTSEDAPEGPPLNVKVTAESSSSLSVTWEPPERNKTNGIIVNYTVCISHEESKPCFKEQTTKEKMLVIGSLNDSTKYYVRVLASTKIGRGPYGESKGKFTNGKQPQVPTNGTETTLTFSLQIPSRSFTHFYVVALKLKDGQDGQSPESYGNNDLVTYAEAEKSSDPKPYIAAIVTSKDGNMFILGDGRNTSNPTSRRRRSTSSDYYNGPLEPGTSYSIFQRIFINNESEYYSTDWSPASKTNEEQPTTPFKNEPSTVYPGGPRVLTNMSSGDIKAKEGDLVNLLCSAQSELPINFTWKKDQKPMKSFMEKDEPHRSSLLVVTVKDQTSFGKYICHIRDQFESTTHTISIQKDTGENYLAGIIVLAILLVISFAIIAYLIYQNRRRKSSKANPENKSKDRNNSKDIYENPDKIQDDANYEEVENEESTYTALKRPGPGKEENDDHLYAHLNDGHKDYVNKKETGF